MNSKIKLILITIVLFIIVVLFQSCGPDIVKVTEYKEKLKSVTVKLPLEVSSNNIPKIGLCSKLFTNLYIKNKNNRKIELFDNSSCVNSGNRYKLCSVEASRPCQVLNKIFFIKGGVLKTLDISNL